MKRVFSVKEINKYTNRLIVNDFLLSNISVRGEVSNCKYHDRYRCVFLSLKDDSEGGSGESISCIIGTKALEKLSYDNVRVKDGMHVIISGKLGMYERDARVRIDIRDLKEEGVGNIYKKLEKLKAEYAEIGYFSEKYKKPLPEYAMTLGIVTARTGAAVEDIIHVARRRNPKLKIYLYPALVQGEGASRSIARGIKRLDEYGLDVIIVGRGGGSVEDLWAFNEPEVVNAVFSARTPIVSAVGHQINDTITDLVADVRAATPSEAAEKAVFELSKLKERIEDIKETLTIRLIDIINKRIRELQNIDNSLRAGIEAKLAVYRQKLAGSRKAVLALNPENIIKENKLKVSILSERLKSAVKDIVKSRREELVRLTTSLEGASPLARISQGFGYLENSDGVRIKSAGEVNIGDDIGIRLSDGEIKAKVTEIKDKDFAGDWQNNLKK